MIRRTGNFIDLTEKEQNKSLSKREQEKLFSRLKREEEEKKFSTQFKKARTDLGRNVGRFGQAVQQPVDFTPEQEALQQMFGGGEKIWGVNNEPVRINNDLNPSQRGEMGTANMFGFGNERRRSGLF